jgi:hypothetical protein
VIDPFDLLRDQLAAAAEAQPRRAQRRLRRPMWIVAAALLCAGAASAAVIAISGEHSQPLAGRAPGLGPGGAAAQYQISFYPRLAAGHTDWCTRAAVRSGRSGAAGGGCGPAPTEAAPLIAGGGMGSTAPGVRSLLWLVVDKRVAQVRLPNGRSIEPRADPLIPYGWRSVVWFGTLPRGDQAWRLLDANGREIPSDSLAGTRAAGTFPLATRTVDPYAPGAGCAIRVARRPHIHALHERVVSEPAPRSTSINTHAFRACAAVALQTHGTRYRAAVLVDAQNPARLAAPLPGMAAGVSGRTPTTANGDITARRAGLAWLAIQGPNPRQRLTLLQTLHAAP